MDTVAHGLAANYYIVAVANVGGVIALVLLLYGFCRWLFRFARTAYRENIRVAIYRARRRAVIEARRSAVDLHLFVANVLMRGVLTLLGLVALLLGLFSSLIMRENAILAHPANPHVHVLAKLVATMSIVAPMVLFMFYTFSLWRLVTNTKRVRWKLMLRYWRTLPASHIDQRGEHKTEGA
jgi:hypothetical protein